MSAPGTVATVTAANGGGTAVAATGQMAEGFEAEQSDASGTGLVSCSHPGSDMWFVGTGQSAGATQVWLYLMNTETVTASADVTILTDTGQQNGLSSAITVAPGQFVKENIAPFVNGSQALALHVQTNTGQVAASVWEGGSGGGAWLPQAAAPATTQVIPGLTVASSAAKLFVVVPGATDAQLKVVAYTPAGAVAQFPGNLVDASAGAATPLALNSLGASAAGLKLTANVPIVAGVLVPGTGIGSFTTAVAAGHRAGRGRGEPGDQGSDRRPAAHRARGRRARQRLGDQRGRHGDEARGRPGGGGGGGPHPGAGRAQAVKRASAVRDRGYPAAGSGPLYAVRVVASGNGGLSAPAASLLPVQSALTIDHAPGRERRYQAVLPVAGYSRPPR